MSLILIVLIVLVLLYLSKDIILAKFSKASPEAPDITVPTEESEEEFTDDISAALKDPFGEIAK